MHKTPSHATGNLMPAVAIWCFIRMRRKHLPLVRTLDRPRNATDELGHLMVFCESSLLKRHSRNSLSKFDIISTSNFKTESFMQGYKDIYSPMTLTFFKMCTGICLGDVPIIQNEQYTTATSPVKNNCQQFNHRYTSYL